MASSTNAFPGFDLWSTPGSLASPNKEFDVTFPGLSVVQQKQPAPKMGPGGVLYNSEIIRSLREANKAPMTNNPGVKLLDNPKNSTLTLNFDRAPKPLSNRPKTLKIDSVDPTAYVPPGDIGGGGGGGNGGGGNDFIFSDYVIDDTDDIDNSWSEWDDWKPDDDPPEDPPEDPPLDPDPPEDPPEDPPLDPDPPEDPPLDPLDPFDDSYDDTLLDTDDTDDPDPWDPGNDDGLDLDPFADIPDDLGDDLIGATDDDGTTGLGFTGDEGSATLDNPDNIVIEGDGVINFGDGGSDTWSEWDDWGDIGEDDLPVDEPFDDRDAFNSLYDFGFGFSGGGGGKSIDDVLIQMMQA